MIETYKILSGKYDTNVVPQFKTTGIQATRGNDLRIFKTRFKYDLRKFYFTNRVVDAWNICQIALLWLTVLTLLNTRRLDIGLYWQDQIIYDFRAQLVTGNRVVTCSDLIKRLYWILVMLKCEMRQA